MKTSRSLGFLALLAIPAVAAAFGGCGSSSSGSSDDSSVIDSGGTDTSIHSDASPDDGATPSDSGPVAPCAAGATYLDDDGGVHSAPAPQSFDEKMSGCPGRVLFDDRATLCNAACTPCSAAQWVAMHGTTKPAYHYWTSDNLNYSGDYGPGVECFATLHATQDGDAGIPYVSACESEYDFDDGGVLVVTAPMRVCFDDNPNGYDDGFSVDPLNNQCNWVRCGLGLADEVLDAGPDADPDAAPPAFDSMGGCDDNYTAGTLCCCP